VSTQGSAKSKLQTRNVFIDTCGFINENFAVSSTAFRSLFSLCRIDKAFVKLTDITVREIDDHLASELTDALKAREGGMTKLKILRNLDWPSLSGMFMPLEHSALYSHLHTRLHAELKNAKAEILPAMNVSPDVIFQKYFDRKPPFGPAKKKAEFPDAFVVTALETWCATKRQSMYVVSTDPDLQSACGNRGPLLHLKSVAEFVDMVLYEEDDEKAEFLAQLFVDNPKPIIEGIKRQFEDRYIYLHDEDGDGEACVNDVELGSASVVSLDDNGAVLELDAEISFTASVSYRDPNMEWHSKSEDLERKEWVPVEVTVKFDQKNHLNYEVSSVTVNNGEPVRIYVDEEAERHWR
jgi:hypothetical protein